MLDDVGCLSSPDTTALCVRTWTILQKTTHYQTWPLPDHKLLGQVVKKNKQKTEHAAHGELLALDSEVTQSLACCICYYTLMTHEHALY